MSKEIVSENPYEKLSPLERNSMLRKIYNHYPKRESLSIDDFDEKSFDESLQSDEDSRSFQDYANFLGPLAKNQKELKYDYARFRRRSNSEYIKKLDESLEQLFSLSPIPTGYKREILFLKDVLLAGNAIFIVVEANIGLGIDEEGKPGIFEYSSAKEMSHLGYQNSLRQMLFARESFINDPETFGDAPFEIPDLEQWRLDHIGIFKDEP